MSTHITLYLSATTCHLLMGGIHRGGGDEHDVSNLT